MSFSSCKKYRDRQGEITDQSDSCCIVIFDGLDKKVVMNNETNCYQSDMHAFLMSFGHFQADYNFMAYGVQVME
jgi:hypothetical protein